MSGIKGGEPSSDGLHPDCTHGEIDFFFLIDKHGCVQFYGGMIDLEFEGNKGIIKLGSCLFILLPKDLFGSCRADAV